MHGREERGEGSTIKKIESLLSPEVISNLFEKTSYNRLKKNSKKIFLKKIYIL